jgi:glycosyltransferase involved in cell wall biosynthesis
VHLLFDYGINKQYVPSWVKLKSFFKCKPFHGITQLQRLFTPRFLYRTIIREHYDVAIAYLQNSTTRIISGCNDKSTKKFAWVHNEKISHATYKSEVEMKQCYEAFDKIAFVSEYCKDVFEQKHKGWNFNGEVINNTLDIKYILHSGEEPINIQLDNDVVNLCSVGRFMHQKGYLRLLEILNRLKNNNIRNWHFYFLGDGEQRSQMESKISEYGLGEFITFLGFQDNPHKFVSKMDLFVCSSYHEGYSTAVTESIILHTPVLTTMCSGMPEILGDENSGIIVDNNDEALYEGLKELLLKTAKIRELKSGAIKRASFFSTERTVSQFEKFISE